MNLKILLVTLYYDIVICLIFLLIYIYLFANFRRNYLKYWVISWFFHFLRKVINIVVLVKPTMFLPVLVYKLSLVLFGLFLLMGVHAFVGNSKSKFFLYTILVLLPITIITTFSRINFLFEETFLGILILGAGILFLKNKELSGVGKLFTGWNFILWGLLTVLGPLHVIAPVIAPDINQWVDHLDFIFQSTVAIGILIMFSQRTRANLLVNEGRFRLLAENTRDIIYRYALKPTLKLEYISPSITQITGYTLEELYADPYLGLRIVHPDDLNSFKQFHQPGNSGQKKVFRWLTKEGNLLWIEHSTMLITENTGNVLGAHGISRDITEQKIIEDALAESKERYSLLAELSPDAIIISKEWKIIYANNAAARHFGYSMETLVGKSVFDLCHPDSINTLNQRINHLNKGYLQPSAEYKIITGNGHIIDVELESAPFIYQDEPALLTVGRNITGRKQTERQIQESRLLIARSERLASLGIMAAGIAHEINQPLNSLKVTADSILYWHEKGKDLEINQLIEKINKISTQAERIDKIIKNVRTLTQTNVQDKTSKCDLNQALQGALELIGNQISVYGIKIQLNLTKNLPPIQGDLHRMEEVIINLLTNAIHALDTVQRQDKIITGTTSFDDQQVVMEVSDNGPGIPEDSRDRIFEPFFTTKPTIDSLGLGLSIAQTIVNKYMGRITAGSSIYGGAAFRLAFPFFDLPVKGAI